LHQVPQFQGGHDNLNDVTAIEINIPVCANIVNAIFINIEKSFALQFSDAQWLI